MRPLKHLITGLGALTVIVGFLLGVPAALITYVGWPLPTTIPSLEEIQLALRGGVDPQLIIKTLAVIVWIVWVQLAVAIVAETAAVVRGRATRRLPVLPGLQPAVAHLLAAITLAVATLGPLRTAPAVATPIPVVASHHVPTPTGDERHVIEAARPAMPQPAEQGRSYRVARHDTLWRIAELALGDGRRWTEIRDLNSGRTMVDGRVFTASTETISPGWVLILPGDAHIPGPAGETASVVTVEAGDSFWTIAKDALADAWGRPPSDREITPYWRQVVDANRDRLAPPHDPNLIYPGQVFELPPTPPDPTIEDSQPEATEQSVASAAEVTVERGDSFWSIAEATLTDAWDRTPTTAETATYWKLLVDANRDRLAPPHDPDLIYPGQVFDLPPIPPDPTVAPDADTTVEAQPTPSTEPSEPVDQPSTSSPAEPAPTPTTPPTLAPAPTTPAAETPEATQVETDAAEPDDDAETPGGLAAVTSRLAGLAVLAAGLVALLRRLRAAQLRHRRPGTVPTPPSRDSASVEAMVRSAAAPTVTELIDLTLRAMARDLLDTHTTALDLVGVHVTTDTLRLLLWTPHTSPPTGWTVEDDGRSWITPTHGDIDRLRHRARGVAAPYPALVTIGHGDHAQLLLNLEYLGATQIIGDPDDVLATCHTIATELAATPFADDLQVVCVGFGIDLTQLERVRTVDEVAEVLADIEAKATAVTRTGTTSPLEGRLSPANGGTWDPIVVIDPTTVGPEEANQLVALAHSGKAVAALVGYPTGDRWRLHVADDTIRVEPLGHTYARRNLTPQEQTAVADLIATAKDLEGLPAELVADPLPTAELEHEPEPAEPASLPTLFDKADEVAGSGPVTRPEIKLLGTIRVEGVDRRFPLRRCTELVAYLSLHRGGVEADTLMEALWPEEPPDYQRLNRHTSRTRTTLGNGPDGQPYVPYITDGIYRISPHLHSDIEHFTTLVRKADRANGNTTAQHLRDALGLVEGTPFTGAGTGYLWAHAQGIITHTIVAIDNAAHRLAEHALASDDPAEATWAARKGLLATGACEQCYRHLMRAALADGNQVAFEATYQELLAVTDSDDGPDGATFLDPETIELYEQATRRRRRQAG